ncbi:MAG: DoxX family protein [Sphingomonas sanxanigenens]|uniref:DoxX family protein n=1 Tax=Sphingomonas sanxanigenens TaxID=397260 RepID=A0A2W5C7N3_9SPHN|nr:MAG: DoxX family protein [Sphingomonas sanxanigenens]
MGFNAGHVVQDEALAMRAAQAIRLAGLYAAPPVMRIALALPFLRSGLTRWDPFPTLSPGTQFLFEDQFKLHLFGRLVDLPSPTLLAYATACAEIVLPLLLLLGLATRLAALGLLAMTAVIQLVVPEGWANFHLYWAALALGIMALGGGPLSLDAALARLFRSRRAST